MTRSECLEKAARCVLKDRQDQYGEPENCFGMIAGMWTAYLGVFLTAFDVSMMMALLKIARAKANPHHGDSLVDLAGYAACGAELAGAAKTGGECRKLGAEAEPDMFPAGTPVEVKSGAYWVAAKYMNRSGDFHFVRMPNGAMEILPPAMIRRAPKAEGCEDLVQKDAPQTPEAVCRHIVDSNPATYGHPHKPTGEELAELAREEDADGGA